MSATGDKKTELFSLTTEQAKRINRLIGKGYKVITTDEFRKRVNQSKKKMKTIIAPLVEVIPPSQPRRRAQVSYNEDDDIEDAQRIVHYDTEKNASKSIYEEPERPRPRATFTEPAPARVRPTPTPSSYVMSSQNKTPLSPKEIISQLQNHPRFQVISGFESSGQNSYAYILQKVESSEYTLQDLMRDMQNLFIDLYGQYPRSSQAYNHAAELEGYLNTMMSIQKSKMKEVKAEKAVIKEVLPTFPVVIQDLVVPELSRIPTLQKKKTINIKTDPKAITIMDKRILGQNIKKLPPEYLSQICKIVYETIETREEYIIDIDTLPLKKVKELQMYVQSCIQKLGEFEVDNQDKNDDDSSESSFIITDDD